jgi:hypothetical protein
VKRHPTYKPPPCGLTAVDDAVSAWPDFFGWKCAHCGGPLRLSDNAAHLIAHGTPDPVPMESGTFLHDLRSDFYWEA